MKFYDFSAKKMNGQEVKMEAFKGKVVLVVNTASKCGLTPQFTELEQLNKKYKEEGLEILGFPCNQFAHQDKGSNEEIQEFCSLNYGVTFNMFQKIEVNGENAHPLYKYLKEQKGFGGFDPNHPLTPLLAHYGIDAKAFNPVHLANTVIYKIHAISYTAKRRVNDRVYPTACNNCSTFLLNS